jgi:hypothetical protein
MTQEMRDMPEPVPLGKYTVRVDHNTTHRPHNSREFIFRVTSGDVTSVYRCEVDMHSLPTKASIRETAAFLLRVQNKSKLFDYESTQRYP